MQKQKADTHNKGLTVAKNRKRHSKIQTFIMAFLIIFVTIIVLTVYGYFFSFDRYQLLRNGVIGCSCCLLIIFSWCYSLITGSLLFDNSYRSMSFLAIYLVGLAFVVAFSFLPENGWVLLCFFILLALTSNPFTGLAAGSTLLTCVMLLSGTNSFTVFLMYFFSGMIGIALFQEVDENFKFGLPIFISVLLQLVNLLANQVLFQSGSLTIQSLIFPSYNILVNCILLFIWLPSYANRVIYPIKNIYSTINDSEYSLMLQIKEVSKKEFFHSIHTAYLTDRICAELEMDVSAAKTAAYYHHADKILDMPDTFMDCMEEKKFPAYAIKIIRQLQRKDTDPLEKETIVVLFCDSVISSLEFFADHGKEINSHYETIIHKIIDKKIDSGILNNSKISIMEMNVLRKKILEEKLYYDFICNNRI